MSYDFKEGSTAEWTRREATRLDRWNAPASADPSIESQRRGFLSRAEHINWDSQPWSGSNGLGSSSAGIHYTDLPSWFAKPFGWALQAVAWAFRIGFILAMCWAIWYFFRI
jgi:hypothetical protein